MLWLTFYFDHLPFAIGLNNLEFPGSCPAFQFQLPSRLFSSPRQGATLAKNGVNSMFPFLNQ